MSISIYYSATRQIPLSTKESTVIDDILLLFPIEALITVCGVDFNGEDFCVYQTTEQHIRSGTIFEGATKLPSNSKESCWSAIQYWCNLLSDIRRVLSDADWLVHIDDYEILWNDSLQSFDLV